MNDELNNGVPVPEDENYHKTKETSESKEKDEKNEPNELDYKVSNEELMNAYKSAHEENASIDREVRDEYGVESVSNDEVTEEDSKEAKQELDDSEVKEKELDNIEQQVQENSEMKIKIAKDMNLGNNGEVAGVDTSKLIEDVEENDSILSVEKQINKHEEQQPKSVPHVSISETTGNIEVTEVEQKDTDKKETVKTPKDPKDNIEAKINSEIHERTEGIIPDKIEEDSGNDLNKTYEEKNVGLDTSEINDEYVFDNASKGNELSEKEKEYLEKNLENARVTEEAIRAKEITKQYAILADEEKKKEKVVSGEFLKSELTEESDADSKKAVEVSNEITEEELDPPLTSEDKIPESVKEIVDKKISTTLLGGKDAKKSDRYHTNMVSDISEAVTRMEVANVDNYRIEKFNPFNTDVTNMLDATSIRNTRRVKVPLLATGANIIMRKFTHLEQTHLFSECFRLRAIYEDDNANLKSRNEAYYRYRLTLTMSLYSHTESLTKIGEKPYRPSFDEYCKIIKYCDFEQLCYAAFVATHDDLNTFQIQCNNIIKDALRDDSPVTVCGHEFTYKTTNESLQYTLNKEISLEDMKSIRKGFPESQELSDNLKSFLEYTHQTYNRVPTTYKHIISHRLPSIYDVLQTFSTVLAAAKEKDKNTGQNKYFIDFFFGNYDAPSYNAEPEVLQQKLYLRMLSSIFKIKLFTISTAGSVDKPKGLYIEMNVDTDPADFNNNIYDSKVAEMKIRSRIFDTIYNLPSKDLIKLLSDGHFKNMMFTQAVGHFLGNIRCPKCGQIIEAVKIPIEDYFFFQIMGAI